MNLIRYLTNRGVPQKAIDELLPRVPAKMQRLPSDDFCDAAKIMDPDKWFYWPDQTRFVVVGQCPNGDGVAIDTEDDAGAVFYVAHELLGAYWPLDEMVVRVADSPSDYVRKRGGDGFPSDYWEAKDRNIH